MSVVPGLVSVIVPTHGRRALVLEAVRSALSQTYLDLEIIVVENGAADGTAEDMAGLGPKVRYIHRAEAGLSPARNAGIAAARGEYLAFLDDDDLWVEEKLALQVPLFRDPRVVVAYGDARLFFSRGREEGLYSVLHTPKEGDVLLDLLLRPFAVCSTLMVRRSALERAGAFDPAFEIAEEYDLLLRLAPLGAFAYVDRPVAWYRIHSGNDSRRRRARLWREQSVLTERTAAAHPDLLRRAPGACALRRAEVAFQLGTALILEGRVWGGFGVWMAGMVRRPLAFLAAAAGAARFFISRRWKRAFA